MTIAMPPAKISWKQRAFRVVRRLCRSVAIMYLLVCLVIAAFQTTLIFPGSLRQGTADVQFEPLPQSERLTLHTPEQVLLAALFSKALTERDREDLQYRSRPTVLYFYGNGDSLAGSLYQLDLFRHLGANCIVIDYPGFGMSGGKASEAGCYAAAEAAYQYVLSRADLDHTKLIPAGWSLGGAVAIDLAWRHRQEGTIAGLMTFSTFTSMLDIAKHHYPFLPVGLMLQHHFKSVEKARELSVPWLLGHGRSDSMIPYGMSEVLASAARGRVTRYSSTPADHNDFFDVSERELVPVLRAFLSGF